MQTPSPRRQSSRPSIYRNMISCGGCGCAAGLDSPVAVTSPLSTPTCDACGAFGSPSPARLRRLQSSTSESPRAMCEPPEFTSLPVKQVETDNAASSTPPPVWFPPGDCTKHAYCPINRICLTDGSLICALCCLEDHPGPDHRVRLLSEHISGLSASVQSSSASFNRELIKVESRAAACEAAAVRVQQEAARAISAFVESLTAVRTALLATRARLDMTYTSSYVVS